MQSRSDARLPQLPCACANLRRAARAVSRLYNRQLQADNIEITQFTILMALQQVGEISQGGLGEILALDSTTLTRMLRLLRDRGWVQSREGGDRRVRIFCLTKAGREKFQHSLPQWKQAQERLKTTLGEKTMKILTGLLAEITLVAT
jgi:DNA-binding MarR family transcriptional regulator